MTVAAAIDSKREAAHAKELDLHRAFVGAIRERIDLVSDVQERRSRDAVAKCTRPSSDERDYVDIRDDVAAETDLPNRC